MLQVICSIDVVAQKLEPKTTVCEGFYKQHLQGICTDNDGNIYWSWTNKIVKTNKDGKILVETDAPSHQGDLCFKDGKIFVAVNLGKFNELPGKANSWVYVYDGATLKKLSEHAVPELVHGAGGMTTTGKKFYIIGGLPPGTNENYIYEYTPGFKFIKRHAVESGYTLMGIQTIAYNNGFWWLGCYGNPKELIKLDKNFKVIGKTIFDASLGIAPVTKNTFLIGSNEKTADGLQGKTQLAVADGIGLKLVE